MGPVFVPELETARLVLAPLSLNDAGGMYALWSEPEVCRFSGPAVDCAGHAIELPAPTRAESDRLLDYWLRRHAEGSGFRWALRLRSSREFIGAAGFNALGKSPEYAYHLHPKYWGKGFMEETSREALAWCVSSRGCSEVVAFIEPPNVRSVHLALRLGFERESRAADGTDRYVLSVDG